MKFGYKPTLTELEPYNQKLDFKTTRDLILKSEGLGFEAVWFTDHMNLSEGMEEGGVAAVQSGYKIGVATFECWTLLSAMAMVTEKVRLGTLVISNLFRNPAVLAKMAATFDMISGGRLEFGIGIGWHKPEFDQYGVPFNTFKERYQKLKEGLEVIKALWTQEVSNYRGKYYTLNGAELEPKPLQKPHPPIVIGGIGENMLKLIAEHADGWNAFFLTEKEFVSKSEILEGYCEEIGRDPSDIEVSHHCHIFISNDQREIDRNIEIFRGRQTPEKFKEVNLIGTPDEIVERIEKYKEAGVVRLQLVFLDTPSHNGIELFAEKVMPEFR